MRIETFVAQINVQADQLALLYSDATEKDFEAFLRDFRKQASKEWSKSLALAKIENVDALVESVIGRIRKRRDDFRSDEIAADI